MTGLTPARHITMVNPNASVFRSALKRASTCLRDTAECPHHTPLGVYSRHHHDLLLEGEVILETRVSDDELALYPIPRAKAAHKGLPSSWGICPDGSLVALRYADWSLHDNSGLDVTNSRFLAELAAMGQAFAAAKLNEILELNVAGRLFEPREGQVTLERTNLSERYQQVTLIPTPLAVRRNNWATVACWGLDPSGQLVPTGTCDTGNGGTTIHKV
jgi:hypothetical protein